MTRKYFGTDGIRGRTNTSVLTPEIAMKAGMAAGRIFTRGEHRHRVVIGKDTRLSGYMIESALVSGFTAVGLSGKVEVLLAATGVSPFPVSPALPARSGDAARLMPNKTAANTRIPIPPKNEVLGLDCIAETEKGLQREFKIPS